MIPYADFLYFGILLYIALPTLLIRRWLGFSRTWVLLATAAMLIVQYGTIAHLLPVIRSRGSFAITGGSPVSGGLAEVRAIWVVMACGLFQWSRGPGFPLDEDAHPVVLALPRGAVLDSAPPGRGPIPAAGHPRRPARVPGDLVRDVPQPGRHLRHPGPADRFAPRRPVLGLPLLLPDDFVGPHRPLPPVQSRLESPASPRRNSGRTWMALSIASSRASCTSSSWRP